MPHRVAWEGNGLSHQSANITKGEDLLFRFNGRTLTVKAFDDCYTLTDEKGLTLRLMIGSVDKPSFPCPRCTRPAAPEHIANGRAKCWHCENRWSL